MITPLKNYKLQRPLKKTPFSSLMILISSLLLISWDLSAAENMAGERKDIAIFLNKANKAIAQDRLTTPSEDNAFNYIEQALAAAPEHPEALKLLEKIIDRYDELVATHLKHGEQTRQKSLAQAKTFHKRAQNIINQHNISNSSLVAMKYKIAHYSIDKNFKPHPETPDAGIESLLNQHIALSESALEENSIKEAQWHAEQADTIAHRYKLSNQKLKLLKDRVLLVTASGKKNDTQNIEELVATHMSLGKQALHNGETEKAQIHQLIAEEIALQYGTNKPEPAAFSKRITKQNAWNKSDAWLKIFGTF